MIDLAKLARGARAVYGNPFNNLFYPIVPVPEDAKAYKALQIDMDICVMSLVDSFQRQYKESLHFVIK